jgi:hypothetical protein
LLFEPLFQSSTKNLRPVALQEVMKPIDVEEPLPGSAMNDLGQVEKRRLSQFQQLLTLQIALASLAGYRSHHGRTMRSERGSLVGKELPRMPHFISARYDAHPIGIQVQRRWHADRFRRHGVRMPIV